MKKHENLIGKRFGKLTVVSFRSVDNNGHAYWLCRCDCGRFKVVRGAHLKDKHVRSCGCWNPRITHGMSGTRIYNIWSKMLQRCYLKSDHAYSSYGGRGISVCREWRKFESFYNWSMDHGYSESLSIDRKNNDGNYEPSNCRWATPKQQANNNRHNHLVNVDGKLITISQYADQLNVEQTRLRKKLVSVNWDTKKLNRKQVI